ncbi:aldehyde dehydrogenase family protein [Erwinia sp. JUb26]|uniref:aldehyde dehydrogenase family protein n=1 Tax=Erwinia sp. JUb26 TaxID=2485126 RepID=UPI000F4A5CA3|nr:aldehyde dehydrogenase family protein [Erwinia sp. JUb26]ROR10106.1 phenylacetaldehyde dehydrogenase [Erwinia sp. JUb26]
MTQVKLLAVVDAFLQREHGHFINGLSQPGGGALRPVVNPATGQEIARVHDGCAEDVSAAMAAAQQAFRGSWAEMTALGRGKLLLKLADAMEQHREELAQIETLCSGKAITLSRELEVDQAVAFLRYFAGWAGKICGETTEISLPPRGGEKYRGFTLREPLGVVVGIIPWNFSIMIAIWKMAAALVCGCTVVLKPSEFTPLTMLRVAQLAADAGFPPGAINVVNGNGGLLGPMLIEHPFCAKVTFTGSVPTGRSVGNAASALAIPVTLELGGKNPALFLADMTVGEMVDGIIEAGYLNQGQICASAERFYLPAEKMDEVLSGLIQRLARLNVASPLDEACQVGPLANKAHLEKIQKLVARAKEDGDEILYGGYSPERPGYYFLPTVVKVRSENSTLMREETFGPVGSFLAYHDEEKVLQQINNSPFGLAASVWTHNLNKAMRYSERMQAGIVWINMHSLLDPALPFGGVKGSGNGREFGSAFINDYTRLKSVMMRY